MQLNTKTSARTCALGESSPKLDFGSQPPAVILMCGLQGSGKTLLVIDAEQRLLFVELEAGRVVRQRQIAAAGQNVEAFRFARTLR